MRMYEENNRIFVDITEEAAAFIAEYGDKSYAADDPLPDHDKLTRMLYRHLVRGGYLTQQYIPSKEVNYDAGQVLIAVTSQGREFLKNAKG